MFIIHYNALIIQVKGRIMCVMGPRAKAFYYKVVVQCLLCMHKTRKKRLHMLVVKTMF